LSEQDLQGFDEKTEDSQPNLHRKRGLNRHLSMDPEFISMDQDDGKGILGPLGIAASDVLVTVQFIVMLGIADPRVWFLENADGVVSSKIYPDTRIVSSIAALAANDIPTIDRTLAVLSALLATDVDAVRSILCLALGDTTRLSHEVSKITRRAGGNVTLPFAMGFCAGASLKMKEVKDMLGPLCNQLNVDNEIAASIVLSTQCVGTVSRRAWQSLCTKAMELQDEDGIVTDEERLLPRFWVVDAIAAILAQDPVQIAKHTSQLDQLLGLDGLWSAVHASGDVFGALTPPEDLSTLSRVLYSIAQNDMLALPHLLRVIGIKSEEAITNITILISVFNRQFSSAELNALEKTFQRQDPDNKVPRGALTAISAALIGDLDQFAYGISQVTKSGGSSGNLGEKVFQHIHGFPELLVSMARSDEHGDVDIFKQVVHTFSNQAMEGRTIRSHSSLHAKSAAAARTARLIGSWHTDNKRGGAESDSIDPNMTAGTTTSLPNPTKGKTAAVSTWTVGMKHVNTLPRQEEDKLFRFIYAVLTMDCKLMLETIDVFGFDKHLAVALARVVENTVETPEQFRDNPFEELIKRVKATHGDKIATPDPAFSNLLNILSAGYGALGDGRVGVSIPMHQLASNYLDETNLQVVDAIFLAQIDAPSHTKRIVACIPALLQLMDLHTNNLEQLVSGLIYLTSPKDSKEAEANALKVVVLKLSESYNTKPDVVAFCIGLARSNMEMVQQISRQVGEFDLDVMSDIFKLVMRLTPICRSIENNGTNQQDEETNNNSSKMSASENTPPAAGTVRRPFFALSFLFFSRRID
jgi:hypothetical protein